MVSSEALEKLGSKVQQVIDIITPLQMEIEELKEKNNTLVREVRSVQHGHEELEHGSSQLREQQQDQQDRLQALLGRMEEV